MKARQLVKQLTELGCTVDQFDGPERAGCDWCGGPNGRLGVITISSLDTSSGRPLLLCTTCAETFLYQKKRQQI